MCWTILEKLSSEITLWKGVDSVTSILSDHQNTVEGSNLLSLKKKEMD